MEAKDAALASEPPFDVGANLGNRRVAYIAAFGLVGAIAAVVLLCTTIAVQVLRNRFVPVPVDLRAGRVLATSGDFVLADSVLYAPAAVIERAKEFLDLRYAYDYRAGPAKILAAGTMLEKGFGEEVLGVPTDVLARWDAGHTRITLQVDSTALRTFGDGVFEVTLAGTRALHNVEYSDQAGARETPFVQRIFVKAVAIGPQFPSGLAIRGAKGDLE